MYRLLIAILAILLAYSTIKIHRGNYNALPIARPNFFSNPIGALCPLQPLALFARQVTT
jgi:hypothetical protein